MKITEKRVTLGELLDVLNVARVREAKPQLTWDVFVYTLSLYFLDHPSLDLRWHDRTKDEDKIYILPHTEIAKALTK